MTLPLKTLKILIPSLCKQNYVCNQWVADLATDTIIYFIYSTMPAAGNPTTILTIDPQNVDYLLRGIDRLAK